MLIVRPENAEDREAIWNVNRAAFDSEAEANLVDALRDGGYVEVSLIAVVEGDIVGHILLSRLPIITGSGAVDAVSLAPMAVVPSRQRQGIGSKLVEAALDAGREQGHEIVFVLGHEEFYPRFGFSAAFAHSVKNPFGGGPAWMATELVPDSLAGIEGRVVYPPPFGELE